MTDTRRHDIDWLRAAATLNILFFHTARFFNFDDWHVKNQDLSAAASVFIEVASQYIMPLFFLLSAFGSYYSLSHRGGGEYLKERFKRLMVPLLFSSVVILSPVQVWIERATHPPFYPHSFGHFMVHDYFHGFYAFGGNFAWSGMHLWYLLYLFVFSVLTLPLLRFLLAPAPRAALGRVAAFSRHPFALFLYALPVLASEMLVHFGPEIVSSGSGGWSPFTYLAFFLAGFAMATDDRAREQMVRQRAWFLAASLLVLAFFLVHDFGRMTTPPGAAPSPAPGPAAFSLADYLFLTVGRSLMSFTFLVTILGYGGKYLAFDHPRLAWINNLLLPFYILHQTIIVFFGYFLRRVDWPVALKYPLLLLATFAAILVLYEFAIRRVRAFRFLFGMKY